MMHGMRWIQPLLGTVGIKLASSLTWISLFPSLQYQSGLYSTLQDTTNQLDPITEAEKEVEEALDQLQSTGVLQSRNRMTIEALLNPTDEIYHMEQATDEDICQAVLAARKAREDAEITDGIDINDDAPVSSA
ncbi:hypothetical protein C0989_011212 [Termitomyces sp. Mn162]|nr:hypothetical protein C0989_011212 [Termitomyces sp. Mn162]KAH0590500.1 hypothetical protein H2248_000647 [Termitomyces sp. 'cryptogamus']